MGYGVKIMAEKLPLEIYKSVKCAGCGCLLEAIPDARNFIAVYGNIMIGLSKGIIGNNLDDEGKVTNVHVDCIPCFRRFITDHLEGL